YVLLVLVVFIMLLFLTCFLASISRILLYFSIVIPPPLLSTLFPYTTLFRSISLITTFKVLFKQNWKMKLQEAAAEFLLRMFWFIDRKSTRLNSSHVSKSYAVFCLKEKRSRFYSSSNDKR